MDVWTFIASSGNVRTERQLMGMDSLLLLLVIMPIGLYPGFAQVF